MGYDFKSPAAKKIFDMLPTLDADPSFLAVVAKGKEAVRDWCKNVVVGIENAIMNIGFQPMDRKPVDEAKQAFRSAVDSYLQSREGAGVLTPEWAAEGLAKASEGLVDSCEGLVAMRAKQIKEWNLGPDKAGAFERKVTELRRHESSVWRAAQGTAIIREAEYTGKKWDSEFFREVVAKWEPARPPGRVVDPPVGPGLHRLPPVPDPPVRIEDPPIVEPPRVEPPRGPGGINE